MQPKPALKSFFGSNCKQTKNMIPAVEVKEVSSVPKPKKKREMKKATKEQKKIESKSTSGTDEDVK